MTFRSHSRPVVVFATNVQWSGTGYGAQHLGAGLAEKGFRILLLELPISVASPIRHPRRFRELTGARLRRIGPTLAVDRPFGVPPQEHRLLRDLNARLLARRVRRDLRRLGWPEPDIVLARHRLSWRLADTFPESLLVANLSDALYFDNADMEGERSAMLNRAHAAVCVSPPLVEEAERAGVEEVLLLPQGVDNATIAEAAGEGPALDLADVPRPRIGLLGTITPRIDFALVDEVVSRRPDWQFVFVGGISALFPDLKRDIPFQRQPNVHFLGERDRRETGRYLAGFDAAWVPYNWSDFNKASNPLKVLEYLAAGLPVVAPEFPALVGAVADATLIPETAQPGDWIEALEAALERRSDKDRTARRSFAAANGWGARTEVLARFLEGLRRDG